MKSQTSSAGLRSTGAWLERNRLALIRAALIAGVFSASLFAAPVMALDGRYPRLAVTAFFGLILFALVLRWPTLGLVLGLAGGMLVPFSWQGGFNLSQIALAGMLAVWFLDMLVVQKRFEFVRSRTMLPLLAFVCSSILSFSLGQFSWYSFAQNAPVEAQLGGLAINLLSAAAFLLVAHLVNDLRKLEFLTWSFVGLGSVYILARFFHQGWIDALYQHGFTAGSMFWTWLAALLVGQVVANGRLGWGGRGLLGFALALTFYVALVQAHDWKSGWLPPLVSVGTVLAIRYWRQARYFVIFAAIPLYFVVTESIGQETWSWETRLDAWDIVLTIANASPILGMGFANYYWYTPLFPIRGYAVQFNSHSQFVDLIAQTGLVGLACFAWLFVEVGLLGLRLIKSAPEGFARGYVFGALGGLAGTLVAASLVDWVLPFVYNIGMTGFRASVLAWLFMGGLVTIEQVVRRRA